MVALLQSLQAMTLALLSLILTTTAAPATKAVPETVREWETLWTDVLAQNVDESGRIDFTSLVGNAAELKEV